jgi:hypothetical protein
MFKSLSILASLVVVAMGSISFAGDDDLFSDVQSSSVFSGSQDSSANSGPGSSLKRIKSPDELRDLLKVVGFEAKVGNGRSVTTTKELSPWTFPVLLVISDDETSINVMLGLKSIDDVAKELPATLLLKMMTTSQQNSPSLLSYSASRKRTEFSLMLKNRNLSGQMLRDEINRLAVMANKSKDVWSAKKAADQNVNRTEKQPQSPVASVTMLAGKWSASRSDKEAFAVEMTTTGTFNLVYIKNGAQTKTSGSFAVSAGKLTLTGTKGLKLEGKITMTSKTEFTFTPQNSTPLIFKKS